MSFSMELTNRRGELAPGAGGGRMRHELPGRQQADEMAEEVAGAGPFVQPANSRS